MSTAITIDWYPVERQSLPAILKGIEKPSGSPLPNPLATSSKDVVLGIANLTGVIESSFPSIMLVGSARKEVLAWISTYAEEAFPLSQFCRVLSTDDWLDLASEQPSSQLIGPANSLWSSLVLGEMLGQVSSDQDVSTIALSRASACFSFAIARTTLLYPHRDTLRNKCADRLSFVENNSRFGRKNISTALLKPIWSAAFAVERIAIGSSDFATYLLGLLKILAPQVLALIESNKLLLSDSAEERVKGFDSIVDYLFAESKHNRISRSHSALCFAVAALLAGRGTSHIQLLGPVAQDFPDAFPWYGLLAGMVGQQYWDKAWSQQVKGVERTLRQCFRLDEPVQADICWIEYDWLARTYDSPEAFSMLPRNFPSGLAIELLPGVICQFRLEDHFGAKLRNEASKTPTEPAKPTNVDNTKEIARVLEMLRQAQELLQKQVPEANKQFGLFVEQELPTTQKPKRSRESRARKSSEK